MPAGDYSASVAMPSELNGGVSRGPAVYEASDTWDLMRPCKDGERTDHLLKLSGSLLARGLPLDQVASICHAWNAQNIDKLPDEKINKTCESIARREAAKHAERQRGHMEVLKENGPLTPLFGPAEAGIHNFLVNTPPTRRWLLKDFLPYGIVGLIVAPGGSGKSQFAMQLAYSIASGAPLANHWEVAEQGTVLMLCAEDDAEEVHRRLHRIHAEHSFQGPPAFTGLMQIRLHIKSVVGEDMLLTRRGASTEVDRTRTLERLGLTVKQFQDLKLVILDPASRFRGGDENKNEDATRFVEALEWLRQETGATILIAHHTNKGAINATEVNQSASRGASAFTDGVRWQLALSAAGSKTKWKGYYSEADQGRYVEAKLVKSNYTAPQPEVLLRRLDGGYLHAAIGNPSPVDQALLPLLVLLRDQGPLTAREVEQHHCGESKTLGVSQKAARSVIKTAVSEGLVDNVQRQPLKLTAHGEALVQELAPRGAGTAPRGRGGRRKKPP